MKVEKIVSIASVNDLAIGLNTDKEGRCIKLLMN
jgi:hypothetical protein